MRAVAPESPELSVGVEHPADMRDEGFEPPTLAV